MKRVKRYREGFEYALQAIVFLLSHEDEKIGPWLRGAYKVDTRHEAMPAALVSFTRETSPGAADQYLAALVDTLMKHAPDGVERPALETWVESCLWLEADEPPRPPDTDSDGRLWLDAGLIEHLSGLGDVGKEFAEGSREQVLTDRWEYWRTMTDKIRQVHGVSKAMGTLAQVLWFDQIRPQMLRALDADKRFPSAALSASTVEVLGAVIGQGIDKESPIDGNNIMLAGGGVSGLVLCESIGPMAHAQVFNMLAQDLNAIEMPHTWPLIHFLGDKQREGLQRRARGESSIQPERIIIEGGFTALARQLHVTQRDLPVLRKLFEIFSRWSLSYQAAGISGGGSFLSWRERREPIPGKSGPPIKILEIDLGLGPLSHGFLSYQPDGTRERLIPLVNPSLLPTPGGYRKTLGAQRNAAQGLMRVFSDNLSEYHDKGGVQMKSKAWNKLADESGFYRSSNKRPIADLVKRWVDGDNPLDLFDGRGPFLEADGDRFRLADGHRAAHEMLEGQHKYRQGLRRKKAKNKGHK